MNLIPSQLFLLKEKLVTCNLTTKEIIHLPKNTLIFLISSEYTRYFGSEELNPDFLKIKFLFNVHVYETEIYDNVGFYFISI